MQWGLAVLLIIADLSYEFASAATVAEVVEQVSAESYTNYLRNDLYTHDGDERYFGPQHDLAQQRIVELFESFGLETSLHPFAYGETTCYNVVGVHRGISCPNEIYVLGAHYDTVEGSPGAWDNGSGVAGILESARVLSQHVFEGTIVFIAFDREEQSSYGSAAYVNDHIEDRIHGMINLDAIAWQAYGPDHPDCNKISLCYPSIPTGLIDGLASAVESWAGLTCVVNPQWNRSSDHAPFDDEGFAAAWLVSYDWQTNPFYHTALDSVDEPDYIDYDLGASVTQAVVGYLATAAMLAPAHIYPDFNGDGDVDIDDCVLLIERWKGSDSQFDIAPPPNGDGVVNDQDLDALLHYWFSDRSSWWDFGLIAHWTLDETEGHIAYDDFGENHAELFGNPLWQPGDGMLDGALRLDGLDDFVGTEYVLDPAEGSLSVFAWVKGGAPGQVVLSQLWGLNWLMADATGGYLRTELREPSHTAESLVSEVTITDGNWHRVGVTWDGTNRVLYVDDVEVAADTQPSLARSAEGLNIGCGPDMMPGTFFSGLIDDLRIYNRAVRLSSTRP
jgi:hypothetical protein